MSTETRAVHLVRRPPGDAHEDFTQRWQAPPGYVVTIFDQRAPDPLHRWDLMMIAAAPEAPLIDAGDAELVTLETEPHQFYDHGTMPADARKLTFLVVARPGVSHEDVVRHWIDIHGPAVAAPMAEVPGALRYVASPAVAPSAGYAGVTELWYADGPASRAHAALLGDDGFGRLADNTIFLVGRELTTS
jgi:hypothetical protein